MSRICGYLSIAAVSMLIAPLHAFAQTSPPPHVPLEKAIGQPQAAKTQVFPSLIVMNARGASIQGSKLTLTGIAPNSIVFADRPHRAAGHDLTWRLLEEWAPGNTSPESFTKDPPNATISVFSRDGSGVRDAVVVLKTPKLQGDTLTFDVDVLEGASPAATGQPRCSSTSSVGRSRRCRSPASRAAARSAARCMREPQPRLPMAQQQHMARMVIRRPRTDRPAATTHCRPAIEAKDIGAPLPDHSNGQRRAVQADGAVNHPR